MYGRNIIPIYIIVSMVKSVSLNFVSVKVVVFRNLTTTLMGELVYIYTPHTGMHGNTKFPTFNSSAVSGSPSAGKSCTGSYA